MESEDETEDERDSTEAENLERDMMSSAGCVEMEWSASTDGSEWGCQRKGGSRGAGSKIYQSSASPATATGADENN